MPLKKGSKVKIEYEGTLEDGTVFDASSKHGGFLEFEIGKQEVVPGFEKAVAGLKKGQEKDFTISPEESYGPYNEKLMKEVPREQIPIEEELKAGMVLLVGLPNGQRLPVKIEKVSADTVTLNLNHPLAGKILHFHVKLVDVS